MWYPLRDPTRVTFRASWQDCCKTAELIATHRRRIRLKVTVGEWESVDQILVGFWLLWRVERAKEGESTSA